MLATPAAAQNFVYWPAPAAVTGTPVPMSYFPMGTPLTLRSRTQVSTKVNKPGDRLYLDVAESLSYRGQVVVPAGSVAVAEVAAVQRNGHFGKKGKLEIRLLYIDTPSGPVRLSGQANDEGTSGTITSVATILFASPLGFLVHGTSAQLPPGTLVRAYLADDMQFAVQPQSQVTAMQAYPDRTLPVSFEAAKGQRQEMPSVSR
ncbi:hypothetical protein [Sphingomonas sp. PP-CE-3G-477]|uniref:hypothetical protein n=1 Tax=Sphingomonas sp. PP-CE-3G-477 TaxID=2135660 RepID=UPI0015E7850F|nr:hypothetical protein [Sphingomonas sp. PP-CE-3G-477]